MKDRPCCEGDLPATALALIQPPGGDSPVLAPATGWAAKPFRPTVFEKPVVTIFFFPELFVKYELAHISIVSLGTFLAHPLQYRRADDLSQ